MLVLRLMETKTLIVKDVTKHVNNTYSTKNYKICDDFKFDLYIMSPQVIICDS